MLRNLVSAEKKAFAAKMRHNPTPAENAAWQFMRSGQLGAKARRQSVIRGWIADFYFPQVRLIVELDGSSHKQEQDAHRDQVLSQIGILTLRFNNRAVWSDRQGMIRTIRDTISQRKTMGIKPFHGRMPVARLPLPMPMPMPNTLPCPCQGAYRPHPRGLPFLQNCAQIRKKGS